MTRKTGAFPVLLGVGGSIAVVAVSLLPWLRSGEVVRSGFALARSAWGAGLADVKPAKALLVVWFLSPMFAATAWTLIAVGLRRPAGAFASMTGLVGLATGITVLATAGTPEIGPYAAIGTGGATLAGGIVLMSGGRRADE